MNTNTDQARNELDSLAVIVAEFEKHDTAAWLRMLRYLMSKYGKPIWRIL